nr:MAG TPA: hypothetical protein [Caudoviricetes sp.]
MPLNFVRKDIRVQGCFNIPACVQPDIGDIQWIQTTIDF